MLIVPFIVESLRQSFLQFMSTTKFFRFLIDGLTDAGKHRGGASSCTKYVAREIRSCTCSLAAMSPTAECLIDCLGQAP